MMRGRLRAHLGRGGAPRCRASDRTREAELAERREKTLLLASWVETNFQRGRIGTFAWDKEERVSGPDSPLRSSSPRLARQRYRRGDCAGNG